MQSEHFEIADNTLILRVKKSPLFIRYTFYFFTSIFFLLPLTGFVLALSSGGGLHIGYFIALFIFGLLGFFMLRISLWNTFGKEVLTFSKKHINYIADYGWFKDAQKEIQLPVEFDVKQIGYSEDETGVLVIKSETQVICSTKMPLSELEILVNRLEGL